MINRSNFSLVYPASILGASNRCPYPLLPSLVGVITVSPRRGQRGESSCDTCKSFSFFLFFFLQLNLQHMEVSRLGIESELQLLTYHSQNIARSDPHLRPRQQLAAPHWVRPGMEPTSSWILYQVLNPLSPEGMLVNPFLILSQGILKWNRRFWWKVLVILIFSSPKISFVGDILGFIKPFFYLLNQKLVSYSIFAFS